MTTSACSKPAGVAAPSVPSDGKCSECGATRFTLARDFTTYTPNISFEAGVADQSESYTHDQPSDHDEAERLYCSGCGTHYAIPQELSE